MPKPTLIIVPGAWHSPEIFTTVVDKLSSFGYKCISIPLLAAGHEPAVKDLTPDTENVHRAVLEEVERGNDVVVVGHSWGGMIIGGALDGLSKVEREKDGKKGGVIKLAYLCAFVPPEGVSLSVARGGNDPDWVIDEPWVSFRDPIATFYHDLPASDAAHWKSKLNRHSFATLNVGAASAAWKTIPSAYLLCEDDRAITPDIQEFMVKTCKDMGADMLVERIFCSHSPFLVKPDETVGFLRRAAGEEV